MSGVRTGFAIPKKATIDIAAGREIALPVCMPGDNSPYGSLSLSEIKSYNIGAGATANQLILQAIKRTVAGKSCRDTIPR
jgi:hypothetical protein